MEEIIIVPIVIGTLVLCLPWLILHYITKWKQAKTLTGEDEQLLDELYDKARRPENRLHTVERIISADNPDFRPAVPSAEDLAQLENKDRKRVCKGKSVILSIVIDWSRIIKKKYMRK